MFPFRGNFHSMKLIDWMRKHGLDEEAMASRVGGITKFGIRKLMYGERNPSSHVAARIEAVTDGHVRLADLIKPKTPRATVDAAHEPERAA